MSAPTGMPLAAAEASSLFTQANRGLTPSSIDRTAIWDQQYPSPSSPTNFKHTLKVARASLEAEGVVQPETQQSRRTLAKQPRLMGIYSPVGDFEYAARPVLDLGYDKACKAVSDFAETIYPLYPCVEMSAVSRHLTLVFLSSAEQGANSPTDYEADTLSLMDMDILKAVLGISLLINYNDGSPLARHLSRYLDWSMEKFLMRRSSQPYDIVIVMLLVSFVIDSVVRLKLRVRLIRVYIPFTSQTSSRHGGWQDWPQKRASSLDCTKSRRN